MSSHCLHYCVFILNCVYDAAALCCKHIRYPSWTAIEDLPLDEPENEEHNQMVAGTDNSRDLVLGVCRTLVSCGVLAHRA